MCTQRVFLTTKFKDDFDAIVMYRLCLKYLVDLYFKAWLVLSEKYHTISVK